MVLFSIVYFYSSPARFVIVSALGLTLYLWVWTVNFIYSLHILFL
jgi:hypothetical protein